MRRVPLFTLVLILIFAGAFWMRVGRKPRPDSSRVVPTSGRDLRGKWLASPDGRTYLVVDDDNGGKCGPIKVDGHVWTAALYSPGGITPGVHEISCGSSAAVEIREGTTFHFNYWGP